MQGEEQGNAARLSLDFPRSSGRSELIIGAGMRHELGNLLQRHAPAHRYAVISDEAVAALHGDAVIRTFESAGLSATLFPFAGGEAAKTPGTWAALVESLAAGGFGRDSCVVALGGGVTGDMAGFVASTFARGVPLVQVPTSLLAMIDASIGGKTGVDLRAGKNLAGTFHQPRLVLADPELLKTLPEGELRGGLAEAVKHGAIADAGYLEWIDGASREILAQRAGSLQRLIADSVRVKARFVAEDAMEAGARAVLNFGHTIGHAVELVSGYAVSHGQAVAIGMVSEARIGEAAGVTRAGTADRLTTVLQRLGLPTVLPAGVTPGAVLAATRSDKKAREGAVRYVLLECVGRVARDGGGEWTRTVEDALVLTGLGPGGEGASGDGPVV